MAMVHKFQHIIDQLQMAPTGSDLRQLDGIALRGLYMFWLGVRVAFSDAERTDPENLKFLQEMESYIRVLERKIEDRGLLNDLLHMRILSMGLFD